MIEVDETAPATLAGNGALLRGAKKIAVFRALPLGDMLCAVPALRSLRFAAPQAHITLVGLPWAAVFVERFRRYIDGYIEFPGFPGFPEREPALDAVPAFLSRMQAEHFDITIQMHDDRELSNALLDACGARIKSGYHAHGQWHPEHGRFAVLEAGEHDILRQLDLMEFLGAETFGDTLEFPLRDDDFRQLQGVAPELADDSPAAKRSGLICIHPGAQLPAHRWLPERFAAVADRLHAAGHRIAIAGTEAEREVTNAVLRRMQVPALDLTGRTDLGTLASLIAQAQLVVCNDTGISQIATAVATPSIIIGSAVSTKRRAPLNRIRHRLICADIPDQPSAQTVCGIDQSCARNVTVETVLAAAFTLLSSSVTASQDYADSRSVSRRSAARSKSRRLAQA